MYVDRPLLLSFMDRKLNTRSTNLRCEVISFYRNFGAASVAVVEEWGGGEVAGGVKHFSIGLIKTKGVFTLDQDELRPA